MPMVRAEGGVHLTGLTPKAAGGYAEQVLAQEALTFAVPNGLAPAHGRARPSRWPSRCTPYAAGRSARARPRSSSAAARSASA